MTTDSNNDEQVSTGGPAQDIIADNTELVSPTRIWANYQLYRKDRPDHSQFLDDAASYYLLNIAEFFSAKASRPACNYANLATVLLDADFRKVLLMLGSEPVPAGKEMYRQHLLKFAPGSLHAKNICTWQGLKDFAKELQQATDLEAVLARVPARRQVLAFIEGYQFLA
jgi:hypothetical protein